MPAGKVMKANQLTLMFCDLVGSTALSNQLDIEDLNDVIHAFHHFSTSVIEQSEGHVAKYSYLGMFEHLALGDEISTDWTDVIAVKPVAMEKWFERKFSGGA